MTETVFNIQKTSPKEAKPLLDAHHALMQSLFNAEANHYLELDALMVPEIAFFGAYLGEGLVGCGALANRTHYGEIKSMFVDPEHRQIGVADAILKLLISEAKRLELPLLRLETGDKLTSAQRLYERNGFVFRGPFGDYPDLPESRFMERRLF